MAPKACRFVRCPCCGLRAPCKALERKHRPAVILVKGKGRGRGFANPAVDVQHDPAWMAWLTDRIGQQLEYLKELASEAGLEVDVQSQPPPDARVHHQEAGSEGMAPDWFPPPSIFDAFGPEPSPKAGPARALPQPKKGALIRRPESKLTKINPE